MEKFTFIVFCLLFALESPAADGLGAPPPEIGKSFMNEGWSRGHLQGFASDGEHLYLSYTDRIFKTDLRGRLLKSVAAQSHQGDCCFALGRLYVAVNLGKFNLEEGADSWVYVYDENLNLLEKHEVPELVYGAGGMEYHGGKFYIVGGLAKGRKNYVYEYTQDFKFTARHEIPVLNSKMGVQTICHNDGHFYLGCYASGDGSSGYTLRTDADFSNPRKIEFDTSLGLIALKKSADGAPRFLLSEGVNIRPATMKNWLKSALFFPATLKDGKFEIEDDCIKNLRYVK